VSALSSPWRVDPSRRERELGGVSRAPTSSGQASLEWIAVLAVVAVLLTAGSALAEGPAVERRVTRAMARAVCVVSGGDCARDREPCVIGARSRRNDTRVDVAVFHFGGGSTMLVEQRSDGTFAITKTTRDVKGGGGGLGVDAHLDAGVVDVSLVGELAASYLAIGHDARTWIVRSRAEAERLAGRLRDEGEERTRRRRPERVRGTLPPLPDPDLTSVGEEQRAALEATAGLRAGGLSTGSAEAHAEGALQAQTGVLVDHRTGHRTLHVEASRSALARLGLPQGLLGRSASTTSGGERYAVEFDTKGRPLSLAVLAAGAFSGSRDLPDVVQPVAGQLSRGTATGERSYEVTTRLDLTDAANLAAARGFLHAIGRQTGFGDAVAASDALRLRLDERGTVEARVLDRAVTTAWSVGAHGRAGIQLGADVEREDMSLSLLAAQSRGLDGQWIAREDCVA
jgi:hypothetical protein